MKRDFSHYKFDKKRNFPKKSQTFSFLFDFANFCRKKFELMLITMHIYIVYTERCRWLCNGCTEMVGMDTATSISTPNRVGWSGWVRHFTKHCERLLSRGKEHNHFYCSHSPIPNVWSSISKSGELRCDRSRYWPWNYTRIWWSRHAFLNLMRAEGSMKGHAVIHIDIS